MSDPARAPLSARQQELVRRFHAGELLALSRAITQVENGVPGFETLLHELHAGVGRARRIGITGPPGAGKSTLTAALARRFRDAGERVGVIAVDPSSPFTGGALLGDRVRMDELATEPGIFIRSMATRGSHGGLAATSREAADLMDAFGFGRVLLETVGVGQSELEIAGSADTTVVVLVPESGDAIQAMKAGLMEVADLFVVNKADRPGAERLRKEIRTVQGFRAGGPRAEERGAAAPSGAAGHHGIDLSGRGSTSGPAGSGAEGGPGAGSDDGDGEASGPKGWEAPVLACVAADGRGVDELVERLEAHFGWLEAEGMLEARRREQALRHVREVLARAVERRAEAAWRSWVEADAPDEETSPYATARRLERELWRPPADPG